MEFKNIVGKYSNKQQAFAHPVDYAMIRLVWTNFGIGNRLKSQSFYEVEYSEKQNPKPYRESFHTFEYVNDTEVLFYTFDSGWNELCVHTICWDGEFWVYQPCDTCIVNDIKIISEIKFNDKKYYGRDAGYDADGKLVWGKETGMFEFDKL